MPIPATAKRAGDITRAKRPLGTRLDVMEVDDGGIWVERARYTNPIPSALARAERRNPGRHFAWDHENDGIRSGIRIWRIS